MKLIARTRSLFLKKEGGKEVLNQKMFFGVMILILVIGVSVIFLSNTSSDNSVIVNATEPIEASNLEMASMPVSQKISGLLQASKQKVLAHKPRQAKPTPKSTVKIRYRAPQVIERQDSFTSKLLLGSNLIGKLLTSIDTRESEQLYKVLLPYGGKGKHGSIPKNTILFGTVNYPNKGRKVFMQFSKALLPNGREVELKAQASECQGLFAWD